MVLEEGRQAIITRLCKEFAGRFAVHVEERPGGRSRGAGTKRLLQEKIGPRYKRGPVGFGSLFYGEVFWRPGQLSAARAEEPFGGEGCGPMAAPRQSRETHSGVMGIPGPPNCFPSTEGARCSSEPVLLGRQSRSLHCQERPCACGRRECHVG